MAATRTWQQPEARLGRGFVIRSGRAPCKVASGPPKRECSPIEPLRKKETTESIGLDVVDKIEKTLSLERKQPSCRARLVKN